MADHVDDIRIHVHPILGERSSSDRVRIWFDGQPLTALAGDSIAVALRAHGYMIARTMPGTDSPRGLFCGVGRCPDCMMTVDGQLNVRTCQAPVRDGMVVETQIGHGIWKGSA